MSTKKLLSLTPAALLTAAVLLVTASVVSGPRLLFAAGCGDPGYCTDQAWCDGTAPEGYTCTCTITTCDNSPPSCSRTCTCSGCEAVDPCPDPPC